MARQSGSGSLTMKPRTIKCVCAGGRGGGRRVAPPKDQSDVTGVSSPREAGECFMSTCVATKLGNVSCSPV